MKSFSRCTTILVSVCALGFLTVACGGTPGVGPVDGIAVSVIATPGSQSTGATGASGAVVLDAVRLVLGGVKLETAGFDGTVDYVVEESRVIEVDLSGEPVSAHTMLDVPAGTYKEVEISIDKLETGNPAEEPLIAQHPDAAEASIVITGRVLGNGSAESFSFTAALDRDMEIPLDPPLVVRAGDDPTGVRVTLTVDLSRWFKTPAGDWLDPRDPANRSAIEANIQTSFEAFEDGDVDGQPGPIAR